MESSRTTRHDKRAYEYSVEDIGNGDCNNSNNNISNNDHSHESKKRKLPALASVIVDALKVDSLQRMCSSLEPLLRRIVSEEVERALTKMGHAPIPGRPQPRRILGPEGKVLQLQFRTKMPPHIFTGAKVEGEQGATIHAVLIDASTGQVVNSGPESSARLGIVVLEGDFNAEDEGEEWTAEHFESQEVKEREGKRPLLTGDVYLTLKQGVGTVGDLTFTDNSSWIRSRKFRLGLKVLPGHCDGVRVREAKTEAFAVKDHRGELYKKHYPPALHDEVWRLDRIAKDGALHKKLIKSDILTVEDFLRLLVKDPQRLRSMLGSGMSNRMWENTVEHAKTCVLGGKLYVYYTDKTHSTGVVFNNIYELRGLISDGQFLSLDSLNHNQKVSVDSIVKRAYENWHEVVEYDGKVLNSSITSRKGKSPNNHVASTQGRRQFQPEPIPSPLQPPIPDTIEFSFPSGLDHPIPGGQLALPVNTDYYNNNNNNNNNNNGFSYFSGDWSRPRGGQGLEDVVAEEIRLRSSEMLEGDDDMQRLLRSFGVGASSSSASNEAACYSYTVRYEPQMIDRTVVGSERRAVVGWLKLKAALRWGIFVRRRAAERRAHLTELD